MDGTNYRILGSLGNGGGPYIDNSCLVYDTGIVIIIAYTVSEGGVWCGWVRFVVQALRLRDPAAWEDVQTAGVFPHLSTMRYP